MAKLYSETEIVAKVEGLTVGRLRTFVSTRCVVPARREGTDRAAFDEVDLARLRLLSELNADFDLDEDGAAMVLSLVDQIHGLRRQLRALGESVAKEPEDVRVRIRRRLERRSG